jgi:hypothetical protein
MPDDYDVSEAMISPKGKVVNSISLVQHFDGKRAGPHRPNSQTEFRLLELKHAISVIGIAFLHHALIELQDDPVGILKEASQILMW